MSGVMSLYKGCKTAVSVDGERSSSFSVKVGVHQGIALSPLLFIMVMDVLTEDVRDGSLMELLYADDLVLCGESLNEVVDKYGRWKNAVGGKDPRVNVNKIKGMRLLFGKKSSVSKKNPCGVCGERVGCNSIQCTKCQRWEDVLKKVEKFCYLGDMICCYGGASEAVSARICSAWKKFMELSGVLVGKQGLSLKQREKIYQ